MRTQLWLGSLVACLCLVGCGGKAGASAAGTYELDRVAMKATLVNEILKHMPEAARAEAKVVASAEETAKEQAASMSMTSVLKTDGTWVSTGSMAGQEVTAKGTWTLEGSELLLITTEQDGKKESKPETNKATLEGDVLTIQPEGAPFQIKLNRK